MLKVCRSDKPSFYERGLSYKRYKQGDMIGRKLERLTTGIFVRDKVRHLGFDYVT